MQIKEMLIWMPVLVFVIWIFAAPVPEQRISRACEPIHWVGNLTTSTTALAAADHVATADHWSNKLNYSCQYMLWRLFYQNEYNDAVKAGLIEASPHANGTGITAPADSVTVVPAKPADQEASEGAK